MKRNIDASGKRFLFRGVVFPSIFYFLLLRSMSELKKILNRCLFSFQWGKKKAFVFVLASRFEMKKEIEFFHLLDHLMLYVALPKRCTTLKKIKKKKHFYFIASDDHSED